MDLTYSVIILVVERKSIDFMQNHRKFFYKTSKAISSKVDDLISK